MKKEHKHRCGICGKSYFCEDENCKKGHARKCKICKRQGELYYKEFINSGKK